MRNEPARTAGGQPLPVVGTQVVTLPNVLSFLRLVGVPVFLWLILAGHDGWALAVLMASGVTDYLDGKIARQYSLVSRLGQLLDPVADRLYIVSTLVGPGLREIIPWWLVAVLLAREVFWRVAAAGASRRTATSVCRCTSSARPPRSTCSTRSRCCCSARAPARSPRSPSRSAGPSPGGATGLYWVAGVLYAVQVRDLRPRGEGAAPGERRPAGPPGPPAAPGRVDDAAHRR